jgi:Ferritin-like
MEEGRGPVGDRSSGSAPPAKGGSAAAVGGGRRSRPPDGLTWHGYLVQLLHIASSIEHALMVQYLYAAYSLDDERPDLEPDERKKVAEWRNLILSVAKEEMGHLLTVQNVMCLLGGQMELVRENYPLDSAFYPFEFSLEPLSIGSLACYAYAEMGDEPPGEPAFQDELQKLVRKHLQERARKSKKKPKQVRGASAHKVGKLYQRISEILGNPKLIPDSLLQENSVPFQAYADEWGRAYGIAVPPSLPRPEFKLSRKYEDICRESENFQKRIADGAMHATIMIERVATRQQALDALMRIAVQGEGRGIEPESHFMRFRSIMKDFLKCRDENADWKPPTHAVADNPQIQWKDVPDEPTGSQITHPLSNKWASLFNLRYRMLLTYLSHSFQLARDGSQAQLRGAVMHKVFAEMYNLKAIAGILVRLPLKEPRRDPLNDRRAGPPFQMPYTLAISMDAMDRWRLHRDLLRGAIELNRDLRNLIDEIRQLELDPIVKLLKFNRNPSLVAKFFDSIAEFLRAMLELDRKSAEWIGKVMAGFAPEQAPSP